MKKSFADILSGIDDRQTKKLESKLPEWAAAGGIEIPSSLALEQCSSTATALYKAALIRKTADKTISGITGIVDITGGLGVDCWAFSRIADKVFYFERNPELAEAVRKNFRTLGIDNVVIANARIVKDSDASTDNARIVKDSDDSSGNNLPADSARIPETSDIPDCDIIYADPARRSDTGRKVFLLEDCTPDVFSMMDLFWRHTPRLLLKLSPMADITMLASRLGEQLKEIHVVGAAGECKELLCLLEKDKAGGKGHPCGFTITVAELGKSTGQRSDPDSISSTGPICSASFTFTPEEERQAEVRYTRELKPGQYLFEPSSALMKSGCFKLISSRFGMDKLSKDTQLYVFDRPTDIRTKPESQPNPTAPENLQGLGKFFLIDEVRKLDKTAMKEMGKANPRAEVSARGIPMRSEELRDRLGCKSGGSKHIFGCSAQIALPEGVVAVERMLLLCTPVSVHPVGVDHQVKLHPTLL